MGYREEIGLHLLSLHVLRPLQHIVEKLVAGRVFTRHPQGNTLPEEVIHRLIVVVAMNVDRPIAPRRFLETLDSTFFHTLLPGANPQPEPDIVIGLTRQPSFAEVIRVVQRGSQQRFSLLWTLVLNMLPGSQKVIDNKLTGYFPSPPSQG